MFYFFFESRNSKEDPVVIWLTGGPGCSSELAVFYENGPFSISHNLSLTLNEYGWDKVSVTLIAFILYIFQDLSIKIGFFVLPVGAEPTVGSLPWISSGYGRERNSRLMFY